MKLEIYWDLGLFIRSLNCMRNCMIFMPLYIVEILKALLVCLWQRTGNVKTIRQSMPHFLIYRNILLSSPDNPVHLKCFTIQQHIQVFNSIIFELEFLKLYDITDSTLTHIASPTSSEKEKLF